MSETYTKLFGSITRSSVWLEDDQTLRVWVTMLALADRRGFVGASVGGLAATARVGREKTLEALAKFMAPDPDSRSKEFDGRRIEEVDRGWILLNYERFRDMRDEEARKEYERKRKQRLRKGLPTKPDVPDTLQMSQDVPARPLLSAQAEAYAEAENKKSERESAERDAADAAVPGGTASLPKEKRERRTDKAVVALRGALKRFIEVPPELTPSNLKRAANRLQAIVDCGHAKDLDDAAACLVHAAVASGKPWPWCLMDAQPKRAMPDYEAIAAKQRAEREKVRV